MSNRLLVSLASCASLFLLGLLLAPVPVVGQPAAEPPASAAADPADNSFAAQKAQWDALDAKIRDTASRYRQAEPEDRDAIRKEFVGLVEQSKQLLPKLRAASIAEYKANPNKDPEVTKALLGLMANHNRLDEYPQALEIGQLLLDNNCSERGLADQMGIAAYCLDDFAAAEMYLSQASKEQALTAVGEQYLMDAAEAKGLWEKEQSVRKTEAESDSPLPRVKLETSKGTLVVELFENEAPDTVGNFINLVEKKYYDGLTFHRVLPGFMAQGGCPDGTGAGGPGYEIYCECGKENHRNHFRGTLSMAHAGKDTGGSQFFITFRRTSHLDGRHTAFGRVVEGQDVLAKLERRDPSSRATQPVPDKILKAEVVRKRDHDYVPKKVQ